MHIPSLSGKGRLLKRASAWGGRGGREGTGAKEKGGAEGKKGERREGQHAARPARPAPLGMIDFGGAPNKKLPLGTGLNENTGSKRNSQSRKKTEEPREAEGRCP